MFCSRLFLPLLVGAFLGTAHAQADLPDPAPSNAPPPTHNTPGAPKNDAATPASPVENDFQLVPGQRAGDVSLGMTSKAILALKGKPSELFPRSEGVEEIHWKDADGHELQVILASDVVVQISVDDPRFKDALGNGINSPLASIFGRYRAKGYDAPKEAKWEFPGEEVSYFDSVYDDKMAGIAFTLTYSEEDNEPSLSSTALTSLVIHRADKPFIPRNKAIPASPKVISVPQPLPEPTPAPRPRPMRARGNGWPLTEKVGESGSRGWSTDLVLLPSKVGFDFYAFTSPPPGQGGLWHPLVWMNVIAVQDRAVWQDVSFVTLSFGGRRLQLEASKETKTNGNSVLTFLNVRVPFRDFLDLARVGKFSLTVDGSSFGVERPQTVGLRALARLCGASDVEVGSGNGSGEGAVTQLPSRAGNEFFPQTSRRRLTQSEVENMSDGDLRLAINEMYARYGLTFKDKSLQARFEGLGWYHPRDERTYEVINDLFSDTERYNRDLLAQERKSRN